MKEAKAIVDYLEEERKCIKTLYSYPDDVLNCEDLIQVMDYIKYLETNWKELKKWLEEMIDWTTTKAHLKEEYDNNYTVEQKNMWWVVQQRKETLDKMQELENKNE